MNNRNSSIDSFKGILTFGMILSHFICIFTDRYMFPAPKFFTFYIDCITFGGFVFSYGYVYKLAYLSKNFMDVYKKIIKGALKAYAAYLISGICYKVLLEKMEFSLKNVLNIAIFNNVPILSEFLIAFSLISIFTLIAFKPLKVILNNKIVFWTVWGIFLLSTFIPADTAKINQIGLIIGTSKFGSFPLLQYMPLFLLGMYFAHYSIVFDFKLFIGSLFTTLIVITYFIKTNMLPSRFPPSILWIIAPMFFLYLYYLASQLIKSSILQFIGKNSLFYLLMSNSIMFAFRGATNLTLQPDPYGIKSFVAAVILIMGITYIAKLVIPDKK